MWVREIAYQDPLDVFARWADAPYVAWLDSAALGDPRSRYSYLAIEPFSLIAADAIGVRVDGRAVAGDSFAVLARILAQYRIEPGLAPLPFIGGAVGFLGYELGRHLETLPGRHDAAPGIPDMVMALYDLVIGFDHQTRRAWLLASGWPETNRVARERRAAARMAAAEQKLAIAPPRSTAPAFVPAAWLPALGQADYVHRVEQVLEHIRAGDIFQANFTARHVAARPAGTPAATLYRRLRALSPAPFAAYIGCGRDLALASASPERFMRLEPDGRLEARPIKGTRPRGATADEDARLRADLAASVKDRAENLMIVDLMRNDIGRVAEFGSVRVPTLCAVESFASVHHLVSSVEARLRPGLGAVDLLRASFPGGSVTGAPKIRAMEIIDALEPTRRGPYCGAIAWLGFDGAMDSSITIRTLVITRDQVIAQAGGGIVADSDPAAEYAEMMVKLRPLLAVLA